PAGERHRLLLRLPPPRRASRGRRRHPLPPRREPLHAAVRGLEVLTQTSHQFRDLPDRWASIGAPRVRTLAHVPPTCTPVRTNYRAARPFAGQLQAENG